MMEPTQQSLKGRLVEISKLVAVRVELVMVEIELLELLRIDVHGNRELASPGGKLGSSYWQFCSIVLNVVVVFCLFLFFREIF